MFAGASVGQAMGGSGVLFLIGVHRLPVQLRRRGRCDPGGHGFVVLPMREALAEALARRRRGGRGCAHGWRRCSASRSSRSARWSARAARSSGVVFALLPAGAMSLGLALQSNLAVELGMNDDAGGRAEPLVDASSPRWPWCSAAGSPTARAAAHAGAVLARHEPAGAVPDVGDAAARLGDAARARRRADPGADHGAVDLDADLRRVPGPDVRHPLGDHHGRHQPRRRGHAVHRLHGDDEPGHRDRASWQGMALEALGVSDHAAARRDPRARVPAAAAVLSSGRSAGFSDALAEGRARKSSLVLGVPCLAWLPCWASTTAGHGRSRSSSTFFTLVFIASALFLLAGAEVLGRAAGAWRRAALGWRRCCC